MNHEGGEGHGFTEEQVRRVLDRAMELDRSMGRNLTEADLHDIAREVGISREAMSVAIRDARFDSLDAEEKSSPNGARERWWIKPLLGATLGIMVGLALPVLMWVGLTIRRTDPAAIPFVLGALLLLQIRAVLLAMRSHGEAKQERFHFANLALWSGFVMGWMGPFEAPWGGFPVQRYVLEATVAFGLVTALFGGITIWLRDPLKMVGAKLGTAVREGLSNVGEKVRRFVPWIGSRSGPMRVARPRPVTLDRSAQ